MLCGEANGSDEYTAYFTNTTSGYLYESYSLAWRYLGMYIDCDLKNGGSGSSSSSNNKNNNNAKYGTDGYNNGNGYQNTCSRKVR